MFRKKFKIRVRQFTDTGSSYCVEYAYYYIFPIWRYINRWNKTHKDSSPIIGNVHQAENFAKHFDTIEKVRMHEVEIAALERGGEKYVSRIIISK